MVKIKNEEKYLIKSMVNLDDYMANKFEGKSYIHEYDYKQELRYMSNYKDTDLFGKSSKTTICLDGKNKSKLLYCENCAKHYTDNVDVMLETGDEKVMKPEDIIEQMGDINEDDKYDYIPYVKIHSVTCKECNTTYNFEDIRVVSRKNKYEMPNRKFVYQKIYSDENLVKLSLKTSTIFVEKAFYSEDSRYKIIFNVNNGQTFLFNCISNAKNREKLFHVKMPILNITFRNEQIDNNLSSVLSDESKEETSYLYNLEQLHKELHKKLSKRLNCTIPTLEDYAKELGITSKSEIYTIKMMALYNRFPRVNTFKIFEMLNVGANQYCSLDIPDKLRSISQTVDTVEFSKEISRLYKLSNSEILLDYINNVTKNKRDGSFVYFKEVAYILRLFEDKDLALSLIKGQSTEKGNFEFKILSSNYDFNETMKIRHNQYSPKLMLLKDMISELGENKMYEILSLYFSNHALISFLFSISNEYYLIKKVDTKCKFDLEKIYEVMVNVYSSFQCSENNIFQIKKNAAEEIIDVIYKNMSNHLYNKFKNTYKFKIKTLEEYHGDYLKYLNEKIVYIREQSGEASYKVPQVSMHLLVAFKIYSINPTENPYKLADMFGLIGSHGINEDIPAFFKTLSKKSTDVIGEILKYYNIPMTKFIRKSLNYNHNNLKLLIYYSTLFSDVNILNNIIQNRYYSEIPSISLFEEVIINGNPNNDNGYASGNIQSRYSLIKALISEKGELETSRKLINSKSSGISEIVLDTARMYNAYKELYPDNKLDFNGSLLEIHDRLIQLTGSSTKPFKKSDFEPFKYTKKVKTLEYKKGEYEFTLPVDGRELVIIGRELKNCVGGYVESVRNKGCIIVYVKHNDDYKVCIELRPYIKSNEEESSDEINYKYVLKQAKLYANTPVGTDAEILALVEEWMAINNIVGDGGDLYPTTASNAHDLENRRVRRNNVVRYSPVQEFGQAIGYDVEF